MRSYFTSNLVDIPSRTRIIKRKKGNLREEKRRPHATPMVTTGCLRDHVSTHLGKRLFVGDKVVLKARCSR
jgi:hypothetical protein